MQINQLPSLNGNLDTHIPRGGANSMNTNMLGQARATNII